MKTTLALLFATMLATTESLSALERNTKMGKPTDEEMQMTQYDPDPEANAVVLYRGVDVSYVLLANKLEIRYKNKVRIKVLKPEGVDEGDVSIVCYDPENSTYRETIVGLKASSYNLENGKVVRTKMTGDLKNKERIDSYHSQVKFTVPNVKVGTVIEYEYSRHSEYTQNIDTWYSQCSIPVFYTTYDVSIPEVYIFHTETSGLENLIAKTEVGRFDLGGGAALSTSDYHIEGSQLPKLKDDPYVFCLADFNTKVEHELNCTKEIATNVLHPFTTTWNSIDSVLINDSDFGKRYKMDNPLKEEQAALNIDHSLPVVQRVAILRDLLLDNYKWDETYRLTGVSTSKLKKEKTGGIGTLNFALMAMLRDEGIDACPVLLSRRNKGRIPYTHASIEALNAMCLRVSTSDSTYCMVDATAEDYPVGTLRPMFLVDRARAVPDQYHGQWIDLRSAGNGRLVNLTNAQLSAEGEVSGSSQLIYEGTMAASPRSSFRLTKDSAELVSKMAQTYELEFDDYQITGVDNRNERIKENITFHKNIDSDGERIYVNPFFFVYLKSSFKDEEDRKLPVEYGYGANEQHTINLAIPEGYEVEEFPKGLSITMPDNGISCKITCHNQGKMLIFRVKYSRSTLFYAKDNYQYLRDLWSKIDETTSQMVVLKKTAN